MECLVVISQMKCLVVIAAVMFGSGHRWNVW